MVLLLLVALLGAAPPAKDLAAPFRLRATTTSPVQTWTRVVDIEGDASGANVTLSDTEHGKDVLRLHRIDARRVAALLKTIDALRWWSQQDQVSPKGVLGPGQKLEVERGATRHEVHVAGGCSVPGKKCAPVELIDALEELARKLPDESLRTLKPPLRLKGPSLWTLETESGLRCRPNSTTGGYLCERPDSGAHAGILRLRDLEGGAVVAETDPDHRWEPVVRTWR